MDASVVMLMAASAAFVGTHFLLSHPLRAPLVRALGERGFAGVYSLVAFATLGWVIVAFRAATPGPLLWNGWADAPWLVASVLTVLAMALLLASLVGNPAMPEASLEGLATREARGVFRVTRHPMMMGFALWAVAHVIVAPSARVIVLAGAMALLALVGAHLQDRKKVALHADAWRAWCGRTAFWPHLGRLADLGWFWLAGLAAWVGATWLHLWLSGIPAGLWRWWP